jgi:ABC-type sugar transport system permease subunit
MARVMSRNAALDAVVAEPVVPARRRAARPSPAWLYLAPALALYALFWLSPAAYSVYLSFFDWDMASPRMTAVGLDNYRRVLTDPVFLTALRNTLLYVVGTVVVGTGVGLGLALAIQRVPGARALYRFVFFLPVVTSITVVSLVWLFFLNTQIGVVNQLLKTLGVPGPNWLNDPATALLALVVVGVWKGFGYNVVLFTAGLAAIDREVYEAAALDGARGWTTFRHVTWPLLSPVTLFVVVMGVIGSFQVFASVQLMTRGGPANATNVLVYHIWEAAFRFFDVGYAAALATLMAALVALLTIVQLRRGERFVHYQ